MHIVEVLGTQREDFYIAAPSSPTYRRLWRLPSFEPTPPAPRHIQVDSTRLRQSTRSYHSPHDVQHTLFHACRAAKSVLSSEVCPRLRMRSRPAAFRMHAALGRWMETTGRPRSGARLMMLPMAGPLAPRERLLGSSGAHGPACPSQPAFSSRAGPGRKSCIEIRICGQRARERGLEPV